MARAPWCITEQETPAENFWRQFCPNYRSALLTRSSFGDINYKRNLHRDAKSLFNGLKNVLVAPPWPIARNDVGTGTKSRGRNVFTHDAPC